MMMAIIGIALAVSGVADDQTETRLDQCLAQPEKASTAGQVECERAALQAYDRRMNSAYVAVLAMLPDSTARLLRQSQREWLRFRDVELTAQAALFATRQGTMFVPMQAGEATTLTRDRALRLEAYQRILAID